jgi:D-alanyl-D-alanine carboxypeptidase/D-alanyl-D-alanine-endopeptidase (penicillin-binding protein 4)
MRHSRRWAAPALALPLALALGVGVALPAAPAAARGAAQAVALAPTSVDPAVDALLQARLVDPRLGRNVGLLVIDAGTGELVSAVDADRPMIPASNMKVVTAVTALAALGADRTLATRVRQGPTPTEIVLEGGGDPLLSTADLQAMAGAVAAALAATLPAGERVVVRVDDDLFPPATRGPGWTTGYIPSVAANVEALARLWDYSRDPSANAAAVFVKALRAAGRPARVGDPLNVDPAAPVLAETTSTVAEAVKIMLRISENNVAEVLFRQVAIASGQPATWRGSRRAAEAVLASLGIDSTGMRLSDGSGLSRTNRVSPRFLASVLRTVRVTNPGPFAVMFERQAMPVSGQTGTLDARYGRYVTTQSRCARGQIRAKTGTLFDTVGLSGIATTVAGPERIFSILVNDRPQRVSTLSTRQAVDGLTATLTGCWS